MKKIAFFDAKSYDRHVFDRLNDHYEISYFKNKLNTHTARFAKGYDAVCAFVNDDLSAPVIKELYQEGVGVIAMGLLICVNRKIHRAYERTRDFNFSIVRLEGMDFHGKTAGVIGTGKIGRVFMDICKGFGMHVIAYDLYPDTSSDIEYVGLDDLLRKSDIISLHCPLTEQTYHMMDENAFGKMKEGALLVNTSRGGLVSSDALLNAVKKRKLAGVALDVYEEEAAFFYEDMSHVIRRNENLATLLSFPNVLITSHQAYLTKEALHNIAEVTLRNLDDYFDGRLSFSTNVC